ncbi:MAG: hypothetical protein JEZ06_00395 [Anaerolineaceae bacterium]|nr:hypothetical protein [Anaerolineaceae bacterium]
MGFMDIYDGLVIGGFVCVVVGLGLWNLTAALIVGGIGLMGLGVLGAVRKEK